MPKTLSRAQVRLVVLLYGAMAALSGLLIFKRYLLYLRHPNDAVSASGMYAGGDLLLEMMVLCFLLVPTAALIFFFRTSEATYTRCAKILVGVSLTAPLSLALMFVPALNRGYLGDVIFFRLLAIPILIVLSVLSLCWNRYAHTRRLISFALLIESLPFAIGIGILLFSAMSRRG